MIADALRVDIPPAPPGGEAPPKQEKLGDSWNKEAEATFRGREAQFVAETEAARLIRRQPGDEGWVGMAPGNGSLMSDAKRRLVYLIQCHHSARYLADLFACLHRPSDVYIINVDSKAPAGLRTLAAMLGSAYPNLHVLPSDPISWGGFSQAEIVLRAIDALPSLGDGWSHLVVLSEQHLPLASPEEIAARLTPGQSLVPYTRFTGSVAAIARGRAASLQHVFPGTAGRRPPDPRTVRPRRRFL